jgi:hypothetical protein
VGTKKPSKPKSRAAARRDEDGPSVFAVVASWLGRGFTIVAIVTLIACGVGWIFGAEALRHRASAIAAQPVTVKFNWPGEPGAGTWVPKAVQGELIRIVEGTLSTDPFDRDSIQRLHDSLLATGWFRKIESLSRKPGGVVRVDAVWRSPAAVVSRAGCEYLIGTDSAVMALPPRFVLDRALFRIENPTSDAARDPVTGDVRYGEAWPLDDVDHALRLLATIAPIPESASVVSVDLSEYPTTGHLLVRTNAGCLLNWGAPVDESAPGEARIAVKLASLRNILSPTARYDRRTARIDINRGHVVAHNTQPGDGHLQ